MLANMRTPCQNITASCGAGLADATARDESRWPQWVSAVEVVGVIGPAGGWRNRMTPEEERAHAPPLAAMPNVPGLLRE